MSTKISIKYIFLSVLVLGAAVTSGVVPPKIIGRASVSEIIRNPCPQYNQNQPELNKCHIERAGEIAKTHGVTLALQYVREVVVKDTNYITTHHVMHIVGREAFYKTKDVARGLRYLPADAFSPPNLIYFDGYQHGLLQAFFYENRNLISQPALLAEAACPGNAAAPDAFYYDEDRGDNCFHGVGHAFMYMENNDVLAAVKDCGALPGLTEKHWCYIGAFMENSYLYNPLYFPEIPRPYVSEDAMVGLCASLEDKWQEGVCSNYIGRAYWAAHYGDVRGAIEQCTLAARPFRKSCVARLARFSLPAFFKTDHQKMVDACRSAGEEYEKACILAAADGISRGAGGYGDQKKIFCGLVGNEFQQPCMAVR